MTSVLFTLGRCVLEEVGGYDVVVTTYEMLKSAAMRPVLVQKLHWRLLVLDEVRVSVRVRVRG